MKVLLTRELGKLAKWLRILGLDAEYMRETTSAEVIMRALREDRVILTRTVRLSEHKGIPTVHIENERTRDQVAEAIKKLKVAMDSDKMFTRCTLCNVRLSEVRQPDIEGAVPTYVFQTQTKFFRCPECKRVYWRGTHWGNVEECLKEMGMGGA